MKTIKIPDFTFNSILGSLYQSSREDRASGWLALAEKTSEIAENIKTLNGDDETALPTGISFQDDDGCVCHCDQRDPTEIAVYFVEDELLAVEWALKTITFGDLTDDVSVLDLYRAMREIDDVITDRIGKD